MFSELSVAAILKGFVERQRGLLTAVAFLKSDAGKRLVSERKEVMFAKLYIHKDLADQTAMDLTFMLQGGGFVEEMCRS